MKPIPGFEDYSVTKSGNIYRTTYKDNGNKAKYQGSHKLTPCIDRYGYPKVVLSKNHKTHYFTVHRLVAVTYIPNPENKPAVNHKNGDKTDNRVENLEWVTEKENTRHAYRTGLHKGCCTKVILRKKGVEIRCGNIVEASQLLGHSRDCFRRHLTTDSRHGLIDGWSFELIGGKNRKEVV